MLADAAGNERAVARLHAVKPQVAHRLEHILLEEADAARVLLPSQRVRLALQQNWFGGRK